MSGWTFSLSLIPGEPEVIRKELQFYVKEEIVWDREIKRAKRIVYLQVIEVVNGATRTAEITIPVEVLFSAWPYIERAMLESGVKATIKAEVEHLIESGIREAMIRVLNRPTG